MKAILIDPTYPDPSIEFVDYKGDLQHMYELIDCSCISAPVSYDNGDTLFCDDEGWLGKKVDDESEGGFMFPGWSYPIFGKSLVTGVDSKGETIDCATLPEDLMKDILFIEHEKMVFLGKQMGVI